MVKTAPSPFLLTMKMFLGEYNPSVTEGSRIALPKRMREQIKSKKIVLTRGFEKCIFLFDAEDWAQQAQKQIENSKEDNKSSKIRDLERYFYSSAQESPIDSQGRFVLPNSLLSYSGIKSKTMILGVGNRVEIWDEDTWKLHFEKITSEIE